MSSIRKTFLVAMGVAAIGVASAASAGVNAGMMDRLNQRDGGDSQSQQQSQSQSAPVYSAPSSSPAPTYSPPPATAMRPQGVSQRSQQQATSQRSENRGGPHNDNPRAGHGVLGGTASRLPDNEGGHHNPGGGTSGGNHDREHHDGDHYRQRPPRVVYALPSSYYDYYWNGNWYYNMNGGWYSPYGSSYISIGAPYGMFVRTLPDYSDSFYYGDERYYYRDNTYYTYDRSRGGYVVSPSPYGDEEGSANVDEDLYVYPAQGQSEKQQADDRYECHRWAVKESKYDPIDDSYDRDRNANYLRAITACLTGKGYTVK